jgi:hypothetical protein
LLVELEEEFDTGAVTGERFFTVADVHSAIQLGEGGRHGDGVVEVGEGGAGKLRVGIEVGFFDSGRKRNRINIDFI